jgi:hypothetical protein
MTNIFIDIFILLEHRSQVEKGVFFVYHLTIESNIPLLLCGSTEITLYVLRFRPTKPKTFHLQSSYPQLQLLINPRPILIHQNHIICKEHTLKMSSLTKSHFFGLPSPRTFQLTKVKGIELFIIMSTEKTASWEHSALSYSSL